MATRKKTTEATDSEEKKPTTRRRRKTTATTSETSTAAKPRRTRRKKPVEKTKRDLTLEESLQILEKYTKEKNYLLQFKNHRKFNRFKNTFRFTVSIISLDFLLSIMEDSAVANVFFNPSIPPPGTGMDGISLRYKIYVEYHQIEE